MAGIDRTHTVHTGMTGQEIWDHVQPFTTPGMTINDVSGIVVVVSYTNGAIDVGGPHKVMHKGLILAEALEYIQKAMTSEDVMDFLVENVDVPDDVSEINPL